MSFLPHKIVGSDYKLQSSWSYLARNEITASFYAPLFLWFLCHFVWCKLFPPEGWPFVVVGRFHTLSFADLVTTCFSLLLLCFMFAICECVVTFSYSHWSSSLKVDSFLNMSQITVFSHWPFPVLVLIFIFAGYFLGKHIVSCTVPFTDDVCSRGPIFKKS